MAEIKKRSIQFRRNISKIYDSSSEAKTAIELQKSTYNDGEQIFGRYKYTDNSGNEKIATLVGLVYVDDSTSPKTTSITYSDIVSVEKEVGKNNLTGGSVNDVDIELTSTTAGTSFDVTVSGDNVPVGDNYTVYTYNTAFTATTAEAVAKTDNVDTAISKVEKSVGALVDEVINNEKVVSEALDQLNESSGFDENGKYTGNTAEGMNYINASTNVTDALEILDKAVDATKKAGISKVEVEQVTSAITHQYTAADADLYNVSATTLNGDTTVDTFQLTYTPYSPSELTVPTTIGDIEKGTKASELNGETLSKILDDIIFPTVYPDLKDPSASIATAATYSSIQKAGAAAPSLKVTYTRGTAKVNDGVTADRNYTGNLTGATYMYSYTAGTANSAAGVSASGTSTAATITSTISSSSITTTVGGSDVATGATTSMILSTVGTYQFRATVNYAAGATLQTSKGDTSNPIRYASLNGTANTTKATIANPHAASNITTSYGVNTYVTLPVFATTANTTDFTELKLVVWGATADTTVNNDTNAWLVTFPDTSKAEPVKVKSPRKLKSINAFNPTSSKYDVALLSSFAETTTTETVNGVSYTYYLYTWNGAVTATGKYKITWN